MRVRSALWKALPGRPPFQTASGAVGVAWLCFPTGTPSTDQGLLSLPTIPALLLGPGPWLKVPTPIQALGKPC